jgi:osmoprotectant transport system permease protein
MKVETKTGLGGTKICFDALTNNQIDLYPEYTGTGLLVLLKPSAQELNSIIGSREKVYAYVQKEFNKRFAIKWLAPIGFNNAYALMMRKSQANALHIKTISGLKLYIDRSK